MLSKILDFFWPRECAVCKGASDRPGRYICSGCLMRLPFLPVDGLCRCCGRDAPAVDGEFLCTGCSSPPRPSFDRVGSVLRFDGYLRELVNAYKFRGALYLRNDFVDFLEAFVRVRFPVEKIAFILPMPSAFANRFWRGYNQCDYLASALAKRLSVPYAGRALKRCGVFRKQSELTADERRVNVKGTFAVTAEGRRFIAGMPPGSSVLVLDDIMTTGSTLSECAKTLKKSSVENVWGVTLARSQMNS